MADHALTFSLGILVGISLVAVPLAVTSFSRKEADRSKSDTTRLSFSGTTESAKSDYDLLIENLEQEFRVNVSKLRDIVKHFNVELNKGLAASGQTIKALPSYVTTLPCGQERGTYLALDLGGTNLRVCECFLEGQGKFRMRQKKWAIGDQLKTTSAEMFFDFIAECTDSFMQAYNIESFENDPIKLGFTFSFPVDQHALDVGTLVHWNKGFEVEDVVGENVVNLLRDAFKRRVSKSMLLFYIILRNCTLMSLRL
jgi:hexokinase